MHLPDLLADNVADFDEADNTISYAVNDDYGNLKVAETSPDYGK